MSFCNCLYKIREKPLQWKFTQVNTSAMQHERTSHYRVWLLLLTLFPISNSHKSSITSSCSSSLSRAHYQALPWTLLNAKLMTDRQILSPWAPVGAKKNNKLVSFNAQPKHPVTKQHLFHKLQTKFIKTKVHTFLYYLNCKVFVRNSSITNSLRLHIKLFIISVLNSAPWGDWVNQFWLPWSAFFQFEFWWMVFVGYY